MIRVSATRYFMAISPLPFWLRAALAAAVAIGGWTLVLDRRGLDSAFGTTLFLQMFAVSSGFGSAAARGYLDPLLVSGRSRRSIAAGSLAAAAIPGILAWLALVSLALALGGDAAASARTMSRHLALLLVSCTAWTLGLALHRLAAGALWTVLLISMAGFRDTLTAFLPAAQAIPQDVVTVFTSAASFVVCPFLLMGDLPAASDLRVLAVTVCIEVLIVSAGCAHIVRREYPLVAPV
jgi:hypothetical protein